MSKNDTMKELTGLEPKFIAETNAFLERFLADPDAGWPLKCPATTSAHCLKQTAPAIEARLPLQTPAAAVERVTVLELLGRLMRLSQQSQTSGAAAGQDRESHLRLVLLLVPDQLLLAAPNLDGTWYGFLGLPEDATYHLGPKRPARAVPRGRIHQVKRSA